MKFSARLFVCVILQSSFPLSDANLLKVGSNEALKTLRIFDQLTDPGVYDNREPPASDKAIEVKTFVAVMILTGIQSQSSEFSSQMEVQYIWEDDRLAYSHFGSGYPPALIGEQVLCQKIWKPSIYIVNEKQSNIIAVPQENKLVKITPNGTVTYSYRIRAGVYCALDLKKFPFDKQLCSILFESWSLSTDQLTLVWNGEKDTEVSSNFPMLEYTLISFKNREGVDSRAGGNYSQLILEFLLKRESGFYIFDFYIPATFLVILSWVAFWLEGGAAATPARVTIGTSTLLTFITLSRNLSAALPKVSYIKAVDVYSLICICFIFASLIEFAFVNSIWRRSRNLEVTKLSTGQVLKTVLTPSLSRRGSLSALSEKSNTKSEDGDSSDSEGCTIEPVSPDANQLTERSFNNQLQLQLLQVNYMRHQRPPSYSPQTSLEIDQNGAPAEDDCETFNIPVPNMAAVDFSKPTKPTKPPAQAMDPREIAKYIDRRCRVFFPALFLLMNILYWSLVWI